MRASASGQSRAQLIEKILCQQHEWDATIMPAFVQRVLSIPLTTQQLKVLALVILEPDGIATAELAGAVGVSVPTMSGIIDRLIGHDMVTRSIDPTDQRVRRITATEAGRSVLRRLAHAQREPGALPFDLLSLDDLDAFLRGMTALIHAIRTQQQRESLAVSEK